MTSGFHVKGKNSFEDLQKKIESMSSPEVFSQIIRMAAYVALFEARRLCPVESGILKSSITVDIMPFSFTLRCGTSYWMYQEYGTRYIKTGTSDSPRLVKSGYSPFMRPAMMKADRFVRGAIKDLVAERQKFIDMANAWPSWMNDTGIVAGESNTWPAWMR